LFLSSTNDDVIYKLPVCVYNYSILVFADDVQAYHPMSGPD